MHWPSLSFMIYIDHSQIRTFSLRISQFPIQMLCVWDVKRFPRRLQINPAFSQLRMIHRRCSRLNRNMIHSSRTLMCLVLPYEHCPSSVEILSDSKTNAFLQYHEWDSLCCTNIFLSVARLLTLLLTLVKVTNHCCCVTWPWQRGGQISYMWPWH